MLPRTASVKPSNGLITQKVMKTGLPVREIEGCLRTHLSVGLVPTFAALFLLVPEGSF
jgi:hypothetical protein